MTATRFRVSRPLYRLLLTLAPRRLRQRHAEEMEALFVERLEEVNGRLGTPGVWTAALIDLLTSAVRELFRKRPGIYLPLASVPRNVMTVAVRTTGEPSAFVATARRIVQDIDPELPLFRIRTMEEAFARSLGQRSLYSWLLAVFAGLAFVLALGGSYGVTAYLVSQRSRELGIRVALGARSADIVRTVLFGGVAVAASGVVTGLAVSLATGRLLERLLFGIPPHDPQVLTSTALVLLVLSAVANWWPARRAARADPLIALRAE